MMKNVGTTNRFDRSALGAGVAALNTTKTVKGPAATAIGDLATVWALTESVGRCPAYDVANFDTL
ncbi:YgaP family membrane protein [Pontibacter litorisediminis]|uniref:YgaP family membrane protein n=1 Tax=Pontibacter litorisediminis TaxID=1846260 RepID=UPI003B849938